jgi:predicted HicB family RNase H-like nuclease
MAGHKLKQRPDFKSEDEEREFWATHELEDYFDFEHAEIVTDPNAFPKLKLTEGLIPLRVNEAMVKKLKSIAKEQKVDLATLAAQYVEQGVLRHSHHAAR